MNFDGGGTKPRVFTRAATVPSLLAAASNLSVTSAAVFTLKTMEEEAATTHCPKTPLLTANLESGSVPLEEHWLMSGSLSYHIVCYGNIEVKMAHEHIFAQRCQNRFMSP